MSSTSTTSTPAKASWIRRNGGFKKVPKQAKRYPQMVTSSDDEIAIWNMSVSTRQVRRRIQRPWKAMK